MAKGGKRSFKNLVVDKGLQRRLSFYFMAINFCVSGIGLVFLANYVYIVRLALLDVPGLTEQGNADLARGLIGLISTAIILVIVIVAANFICGLYLAHRFAGPMKVINDYVDDLIAGKYGSKRNLRPNDELKPIMAKLQELSSTLQDSKS